MSISTALDAEVLAKVAQDESLLYRQMAEVSVNFVKKGGEKFEGTPEAENAKVSLTGDSEIQPVLECQAYFSQQIQVSPDVVAEYWDVIKENAGKYSTNVPYYSDFVRAVSKAVENSDGFFIDREDKSDRRRKEEILSMRYGGVVWRPNTQLELGVEGIDGEAITIENIADYEPPTGKGVALDYTLRRWFTLEIEATAYPSNEVEFDSDGFYEESTWDAYELCESTLGNVGWVSSVGGEWNPRG